MFTEDIAEIREWAQSGPEGVFSVGLFVLCTINRQFHTVKKQIDNYRTYGLTAPEHNGRWMKSVTELSYRATALHEELVASRQKKTVPEDLVAFAEMRGFGLVKGAFFLSMLSDNYDAIGCLDRHNLREQNVHSRAFRSYTLENATRYAAMCQIMYGGGEALWNNWCTATYLRYPNHWTSADHVSKYHVQCTKGVWNV